MSNQGNRDAPFTQLLRIAEEVLQSLRSALPHPLQRQLNAVPILLEDLPSSAQIKDGIADNQLGLFVGAPVGETHSTHPPRIILWLRNHWDMCNAIESDYRAEVRTTLLHELGHFLGLDEAEINERELQ
jgi:predicted Zn-dependent protease with MMP-like domain